MGYFSSEGRQIIGSTFDQNKNLEKRTSTFTQYEDKEKKAYQKLRTELIKVQFFWFH